MVFIETTRQRESQTAQHVSEGKFSTKISKLKDVKINVPKFGLKNLMFIVKRSKYGSSLFLNPCITGPVKMQKLKFCTV